MHEDKFILKVEKILDDWDPIGVLQDYIPITYHDVVIGEYSRYIKPIIETYLKGNSINDFLLNLYSLIRDYPNENIKEEIKEVYKKIIALLSEYDKDDIKKFIE